MSNHKHGHSRKRGKRTFFTPDAVANFARREWEKQRGYVYDCDTECCTDEFFVIGNPPFTIQPANETKGTNE